MDNTKNYSNKREVFFKFHNDFMRNKDSKYYFKSNDDGQLDYLVYIALVYSSNAMNEFSVVLNKLVENIGYKPKSGSGSINDKVRKSIKRLEDRKLIEVASIDKQHILGIVILEDIENRFFKVYAENIIKIIDTLSLKVCTNDFFSKYNDKAKAVYVYSYLLSMMGIHNTTGININWFGCYPSMDMICEECNISKTHLKRLLAYFEYDGLIYTANIGQVTGKDGRKVMASNYYTNNINDLFSGYTYCKAYYDKEHYTYAKYIKRTKQLLSKIKEMLEQSKNKIDEKSKNDFIKFKEHFILMLKDTIHYADKNGYKHISIDNVDEYINNKVYLESKFYNKDTDKTLLFIADKEAYSLVFLTHIKNKLKALMYMYDVLK